MKNLKQILVALAIGTLMCGALTGCADAVPEDAPLRDLMEKTEVETQKPDVEKPDDSDSETDSETDKPTESESDKDSDKDSGSADSDKNSGSSNSSNTASKPSGSGNSGSSKPSGGSGNSGGNSKPAHTTHSWNGGSVTKSPTCSASGTKTYTCTVCGATKQKTIGATGNHKWANHTATKQEKYWVEGETTYKAVCGCGATFNSAKEQSAHATMAALNGDNGNHNYCGDTPIKGEGHWAYKDVSYTDYQYCSVCGARK